MAHLFRALPIPPPPSLPPPPSDFISGTACCRPYLISDGGNVVISEIDGPVVKLELQGNCGSCPSSTMTMKMGLERRLKEAIPEISEVVQAMPDSPPLTEEAIDGILSGIRPFLQVSVEPKFKGREHAES